MPAIARRYMLRMPSIQEPHTQNVHIVFIDGLKVCMGYTGPWELSPLPIPSKRTDLSSLTRRAVGGPLCGLRRPR
jgi:hypothetical protein